MAENRLPLPHTLSLDERKRLTMTGVREVLSFDDTMVELQTDLGTLLVQGSGLKLKNLSVDGGQVAVDGQVDALHYQEPRAPGGWFRRLLG